MDFKLFAQEISRAISFAEFSEGNKRAIKMLMIATTVSNSINVKRRENEKLPREARNTFPRSII